MNVVVEPQLAAVAVARLAGRLDIFGGAAVYEAVRHTVSGGRPQLVLDLGGVTFLDTSGLCTLALAYQEARRAGGGLRLSRPNGGVLEVLVASRLVEVIPCHASVEEALHGLSGRPVADK